MKAFFASFDWERVDSDLERLPYLAWQLEKRAPAVKGRPAAAGDLSTFAPVPDRKEHLDREILSQVSVLMAEYEACLSRIRACRAEPRQKRRKSDIERILYGRGQEDLWDTDELYARLTALPPGRVDEVLEALRREKWQFLGEEERERFLLARLLEFQGLFDLFSDFRSGGYRVLGDLLCDISEENQAEDRRQLIRSGDSAAFADLMTAYLEKRSSQSYREAVALRCRALLDGIVKPAVAVRYVVALGKRNLLWDLLLDALEPNVLEVRHAE